MKPTLRILTVLIISIASLGWLAPAEAAKEESHRYVAYRHFLVSGAVSEAALGAANKPVVFVPTTRTLTLRLDDDVTPDGDFITVHLIQRGKTLFRDCVQVGRSERFRVTPSQPVYVEVEALPLCTDGRCDMYRADPVFPYTIPVCEGAPPWTTGTTGTVTLRSA